MQTNAILCPERHARIIKDLEHLCAVAGIPTAMMYKSAKDFCATQELEWLIRFPVYQRMNKGLVLTGKHNPPPDTKMMAMAAALLRNYVDARVVTVQTLLDAMEERDSVPDPTVLLVPNLYVRQGGKGLPSWKMQLIYDLLVKRFTAGKVSVVYIEKKDAMASDYGTLFVQHIEANYMQSEG